MNECIASPCQNGGSCNNTMGSYTCTCSQDYVGATCDTGKCRGGGNHHVRKNRPPFIALQPLNP